jgi:demethylmenaquinone methyltransferase/2-methoxy-6-polyprenyl-1,4-benzoquinol methylase
VGINMGENDEIENYYAKRALEYENIYSKPERQKYIKEAKEILKKYLDNKSVLEIACGTGFWTEIISEVSKSILAVDYNNEVMEIAREKRYNCNIEFIQDDAYKLSKVKGNCEALFAGFWFSHIPKQRIRNFFENIHKKLIKNALVIIMDNFYIEGNSTPVSRYDTDGNSYQIRKLNDNNQYEIVKNFYNKNELKNYFTDYGKEIEIDDLNYYWIIKYIKK